jgi:hypothetical protein
MTRVLKRVRAAMAAAGDAAAAAGGEMRAVSDSERAMAVLAKARAEDAQRQAEAGCGCEPDNAGAAELVANEGGSREAGGANEGAPPCTLSVVFEELLKRYGCQRSLARVFPFRYLAPISTASVWFLVYYRAFTDMAGL